MDFDIVGGLRFLGFFSGRCQKFRAKMTLRARPPITPNPTRHSDLEPSHARLQSREPRSPKTSHLPPKTNKTAQKRLSPPPFAPTSHLPSLLKSAEMRGNEREIDLFALYRVRVSPNAPESRC